MESRINQFTESSQMKMSSSNRKVVRVGVEISPSNFGAETACQSLEFFERGKKKKQKNQGTRKKVKGAGHQPQLLELQPDLNAGPRVRLQLLRH